MNTPSQNTPVRQYLLAKTSVGYYAGSRRPYSCTDTGLRNIKNLTFDEAFAGSISWEEELKTDRPSLTTYNEFLATPLLGKFIGKSVKV